MSFPKMTIAQTCSSGRGWIAGFEPGSPIVRGKIEGPEDIAAIEAFSPEDVLPGRTAYECLVAATRLDPSKTAVLAIGVGGDPESNEPLSGRETRRARRLSRGGSHDHVASLLPSEVSRIAHSIQRSPNPHCLFFVCRILRWVARTKRSSLSNR